MIDDKLAVAILRIRELRVELAWRPARDRPQLEQAIARWQKVLDNN